jgi:hypothetical protein
MHEGAPMLVSITARPIKDRIAEWPDDDADLWSVWSVPADDTMTPAHDITAQFAKTWAMDLKPGPVPAFVAAHLEELPNPLRKRA